MSSFSRSSLALVLALTVCCHAAVITLPIRNTAELACVVAQVSDPTHPRYLQHLSADELHDKFAPTAAQVAHKNYTFPTPGRHWQVDDPSAVVAQPKVRVSRFQAGGGGVVDVVVGATLAKVYNYTDGAPLVNRVKIAIISEQDQYLPSDVQLFQNISALLTRASAFSQVDATLSTAGAESTLDVEAVLMTAPQGVQVEFIYSAGGFNAWCTYILNLPDAQWPDIVTMSWGETEQVGNYDEAQLDHCLQLLAAGGVTVLVASGDDGAYGAGNPGCASCGGFVGAYPATSAYVTSVGATAFTMAQQGPLHTSPMCGASSIAALCRTYNLSLGPAFAAVSADPFFCASHVAQGSEVAVSFDLAQFFSGGGFSAVWPRPSWQDTAVQQYLSAAPLPPTTYPASCTPATGAVWSPSMRGYPDIAMYGAGVVIVKGAALAYEGGTSLSAPLLAGALAHFVDFFKTLHNGSGPGLLNPLLYSLPTTAFNDVVVGTNNGTELKEPSACSALGGFTTAPGWDAVTGLGTPNIGLMQYYLTQNNSIPTNFIINQTVGEGGGSGGGGVGLPAAAVAVISVFGALSGLLFGVWLLSYLVRVS